MQLAHSPIFLIGYRGAGKSAVGRLLAQRLGWSFLDTDDLLIARQGRSIRQLFAESGEAAFRDMETAILEEVCQLNRQVIATGGGIVLRKENRQRMKSAGKIILLTADVNTLWTRLQADQTTLDRRPALTVGGKEEIQSLLRERGPLYAECADFLLDTANRTPEDVAAAVLEKLSLS